MLLYPSCLHKVLWRTRLLRPGQKNCSWKSSETFVSVRRATMFCIGQHHRTHCCRHMCSCSAGDLQVVLLPLHGRVPVGSGGGARLDLLTWRWSSMNKAMDWLISQSMNNISMTTVTRILWLPRSKSTLSRIGSYEEPGSRSAQWMM